MAISNYPITVDDQNINQMRYLIEQRAEWMYELCEEMEAHGVEYEEIARAAISRFGCRRGQCMVEGLPGKGHSLVELAKYFQESPNTTVFEKEYVQVSEDKLEIDFHYCPLLACWQKLTGDEKKLAKLCDIAMDGDRGMFGAVPGSEFILKSTLAEGAPVCKMIIQKRTNAQE